MESEISSQILSDLSPKVQLIEFSAKDNVGIFRLQGQYPDRAEWVDPMWLMERDEVCGRGLGAGRSVACVAYHEKISEDDSQLIKDVAAVQLLNQLQQGSIRVSHSYPGTKKTYRLLLPSTVCRFTHRLGLGEGCRKAFCPCLIARSKRYIVHHFLVLVRLIGTCRKSRVSAH